MFSVALRTNHSVGLFQINVLAMAGYTKHFIFSLSQRFTNISDKTIRTLNIQGRFDASILSRPRSSRLKRKKGLHFKQLNQFQSLFYNKLFDYRLKIFIKVFEHA